MDFDLTFWFQGIPCGKPFISHQTSTLRTLLHVPAPASATAGQIMWPTTILRCSLTSQGTRQKPPPWRQTQSRSLTPSWLWWQRQWRSTRDQWSLWRCRCPQGTSYGSPGCSPAALRTNSSASASRTSRSHQSLVSRQHRVWTQGLTQGPQFDTKCLLNCLQVSLPCEKLHQLWRSFLSVYVGNNLFSRYVGVLKIGMKTTT